MIETTGGVLVRESLTVAPGGVRLVFGTHDFALDLDLFGDPIGFDYAASRIVLASRAAGIAAPMAGVMPALDDEAQLLADLARARVHPIQVRPAGSWPLHLNLV